MGNCNKQFALTITVSMALSALIALSLTPALCALILKPRTAETEPKGILGKIVGGFNAWYARALSKYTANVEKAIRHTKLVVAAMAVMVIVIGVMAKTLPSGFVPDEDQGACIVAYNLPEASSSNRGIQAMLKAGGQVEKLPGVKSVIEISGMDILTNAPKASAGLLVASMEDFDKRDVDVQSTIKKIYGIGAGMPEMSMMAFNMPALPGASSTGNLGMYLMNLGGDSTEQMNTLGADLLAKS